MCVCVRACVRVRVRVLWIVMILDSGDSVIFHASPHHALFFCNLDSRCAHQIGSQVSRHQEGFTELPDIDQVCTWSFSGVKYSVMLATLIL